MLNMEREIYWNIPRLWIALLYGSFIIATVIFLCGIFRHIRLIRLGKKLNRLDNLFTRLSNLVYYALFQRRILEKPYQAFTHSGIFYGMLILYIGTLLVLIQADFGLTILKGEFYKYFSLFLDLAGGFLLLGLVLALIRRYIIKPAELDNTADDLIVLILLATIVISGFLLEGIRIAITEIPQELPIRYFSPIGLLVGQILLSLGLTQTISFYLYPILWLTHAILAMIFIAYLPFSKLMHIFTVPLNIFFSNLSHVGALSKIELETSEDFGATKITDFFWKDLLDLDSCTKCGRCNTGCPANLTNKPLKPKQLIINLKKHLFNKQKINSNLSPDTVSYDEVWSCTTCGFCSSKCPVFVEQPAKITELRRHLVLAESNFPQEVTAVFKNMETHGNPWAVSWDKRSDWCKDSEVKILNEGEKTNLLLWVGCAGATDERNTKVVRALVNLLQKADVDFAILGNQERCCGDPARRIGNEYLYQQLAEENIQTLKKYQFSKIITCCPHCYNTLKNEYPQLNGNFSVVHHTEFIWELIQIGKLSLSKSQILNLKSQLVTYHDSCYLGRYNNIYSSPRKILTTIAGAKFKEMKRHHKNSLCCGAGGGRMWMEEKLGARINQARVQEALEVIKEGIIVTACPYCLTMLEDGIKEKDALNSLKARDIVEIVSNSILV
jgi:Fe-S oxidoreductase/nitrate reductase gamma subunit